MNDEGVVGLAWLDGRDDPDGRCYQVYFTASLDGGRTFLPEEPVSSARSCPDSTVNGAAFERWPTGGDYFGMTAAADGRFHLLWADARTGKYQLWTAPVTVQTKVE